MDFLYTIDPSATEPIMLINKHIGMDTEDGEGIMGDQFTRELMFLDTLNKKRIQVWINSGGGVVTDGEQIFHAILKSKTPVDTYNTGTAASIAGPIFAAGRNRCMMDYSKLMMHPVSGGDEKSTKAFEQSIKMMLSSRSFLSEEQIGKLMAKTSWIFPDECKELGLCNEIDYAHGANTNGIDKQTSSYKEYNKIVNKLIENKKPQKMGKVTNRLKLNDSANDEAIVEAIDAIENKYKATEAENKSKFDKFLDERKDAKDKYDALQAKYDSLTAKFDAEEKEKTEKDKLANENKAKELVTNAVKTGKIGSDDAIVADWTKQALADFDTTKNIIEKLPINVKKVTNTADEKGLLEKRKAETETPSIDVNNPNAYAALMNAKNANKATNRFK